METLDGRTLPTSDQKLGLVELRSKSPHEKEAVRRALSKIVITVEYEDIYGTKFQTKQNLDFFERTL